MFKSPIKNNKMKKKLIEDIKMGKTGFLTIKIRELKKN